MEKIRTFIAIPLPQNILAEFGKLYQAMSPFSREVKWIKPESVHLTLKFLGNLIPADVKKVFDGMAEVFSDPPDHFLLEIGGLGGFPNLRRPRVLWVGVHGKGLNQLKDIQMRIEEAMTARNFPKENRKFSPHLTVGRVKYYKNLEKIVESFQSYAFPEMKFIVEKIHVMRSELKPEGAVYSVFS